MKRLSNKKLLNLIETLSVVWEDGPQNLKTANKLFGEIYTISHQAGNCKNPHNDWREETKNWYSQFKELGWL